MSKIYLVFHILLLEPALKNTKITENVEINNDTEQEYKVKKILNHKQVSGKLYYLVKWKGYNTSENTWEPIENLIGCHQLIQQYCLKGNQSSPRRKGASDQSLSSSD
jgi:hypothetical protein